MMHRMMTAWTLIAPLALPAVAFAHEHPDECNGQLSGVVDLSNQVESWKQIAAIWEKDPSHHLEPKEPAITQSLYYGPYVVGRQTYGRDPIYLEVSSLIPGSRLQMVDLNQDPDADFKEPIELNLHGANVVQGMASVLLNEQEIAALHLAPNHNYLLRAIAPNGQHSPIAAGVFTRQGQAYANYQSLEANGNRSQVAVGPGPNVSEKPVAEWKHLHIKPGPEHSATISGWGVVAPGVAMRIANMRNGKVYNVTAERGRGGYGEFKLELDDVRNDDMLLITPNWQGTEGESSVFHYDCE